jgi:hypothetical protein
MIEKAEDITPDLVETPGAFEILLYNGGSLYIEHEDTEYVVSVYSDDENMLPEANEPVYYAVYRLFSDALDDACGWSPWNDSISSALRQLAQDAAVWEQWRDKLHG